MLASSTKHFSPMIHAAIYLIGDGTGMGKGRKIAGLILENCLRGRKKAIWVSSSMNPLYDAKQDLDDINACNIPIYSLNEM